MFNFLRALLPIREQKRKIKPKVNQMAKEPEAKKVFKKTDLPYYDDEEGYADALEGYQEKGKK